MTLAGVAWSGFKNILLSPRSAYIWTRGWPQPATNLPQSTFYINISLFISFLLFMYIRILCCTAYYIFLCPIDKTKQNWIQYTIFMFSSKNFTHPLGFWVLLPYIFSRRSLSLRLLPGVWRSSKVHLAHHSSLLSFIRRLSGLVSQFLRRQEGKRTIMKTLLIVRQNIWQMSTISSWSI